MTARAFKYLRKYLLLLKRVEVLERELELKKFADELWDGKKK